MTSKYFSSVLFKTPSNVEMRAVFEQFLLRQNTNNKIYFNVKKSAPLPLKLPAYTIPNLLLFVSELATKSLS